MKRLLSIPLLAALLLLCLPTAALADGSFGSFSAKAVRPDNQVNARNTFFDLLLEPGQEQTIELLVTNSAAEPMTAEIALNAAATGRGGLIIYSRPDVRDESMALSINEVATLRQTAVDIPAGGEASVFIDLRMPDEEFDGVLLGGLVVSQRRDADTDAQNQGVNLKNELSYVVGLQLRQTMNAVEPELHLRGIEPGTVNYHTAVTVTLQNSEPVAMKGMQVDAAVYGGGAEAEPLRTLSLGNAEMAPNSAGEFVISWEDQALEPGDYRLRMTARHEDRLWEWDERFTISPAVATDANTGAVGVVVDRGAQRWLTATLLLLVLAVIALTIWRILRDRSHRHRLQGGAM